MANRYSQTDKWQDEDFLELSDQQKVLYFYIHETCDIAGFYQVNPRLNAFHLNWDQSKYIEVLNTLVELYEVSEDKKTLWIKAYIYDQGNAPLRDNNAHKGIAKRMAKNINRFQCLQDYIPSLDPNDFIEYELDILGATEGLSRGTCNSKSNSKCKGSSSGSSSSSSSSSSSNNKEEDTYIETYEMRRLREITEEREEN